LVQSVHHPLAADRLQIIDLAQLGHPRPPCRACLYSKRAAAVKVKPNRIVGKPLTRNAKGSTLNTGQATPNTESAVPVQMELRRIIISEVDDHQVIILKEVDGDRSFPIVIGIFEATSIDRRVRGLTAPRPLTHDLITAVVEQMGGEIQDIVISDLREHTYFAKLRVRKEGELIDVDCRPSDAIALAVTARVPIYVSEDVLGVALDEE